MDVPNSLSVNNRARRGLLTRMRSRTTLEEWEKRTEWPLATVAVIFLAAYSIHVLAQPQGRAETALQKVIWVTWAVFLLDYVARFSIAPTVRVGSSVTCWTSQSLHFRYCVL